jgi:hypothetical protein
MPGAFLKMPKTRVLLFISIGLMLLSSISIAPNFGRVPVLTPKGSEVRKSSGDVLTKPDQWGYIKSNSFGFAAAAFSVFFFAIAIGRLFWSSWLRILRYVNARRAC